MATIKVLHVLSVFIWTGNLLCLSRMLGYHVKQDEATQLRLAPVYKRMYNFVGLPTMATAIIFGGFLIKNLNQELGLGWFLYKMMFVVGLVVCDVICGHFISKLIQEPDTSRGVPYKILHGIIGLLLVGILICLYIFHPSR